MGCLSLSKEVPSPGIFRAGNGHRLVRKGLRSQLPVGARSIGHEPIIGAGAVVAKEVPPMTVVTGPGYMVRRHLQGSAGEDAE